MWACMTADGINSFVFIADLTSEKCCLMHSEEYGAILSAQVQPNASKLIGQCFMEQMDNEPKHTVKNNPRLFLGKNWRLLQWICQPSEFSSFEHSIYLPEAELKVKHSKNM